ncbi:transposable element Tcb1 transposase [Trichonephila clavipes]|nr:transposable element Tcb1 transposase [Trichonephila clavipes]
MVRNHLHVTYPENRVECRRLVALLPLFPPNLSMNVLLWCHLNSFNREIGSRVGRSQATVMRICDRWMQEGTTDRSGRSHPPQCTTTHENRHIVHMALTDLSVRTRSCVQLIETVTHHSVSARTIRRRLQQSGLSAGRPLLGVPLTQNQ